MKITYATNFLRVFKLPDEFPSDYCFGNLEHPITIKMVDWFNAISQLDFQKVETVIEQTEAEYKEWVGTIKDFIKEKKYFNPLFTYMVMTDYGAVFIVNPEKRINDLQKQFNCMATKAASKKGSEKYGS